MEMVNRFIGGINIYQGNYLHISHSLGVLDWYIPGLSELPLGNRLRLLHAGPFQRFFVLSISLALSVILLFFLRSFRVVRVLGARHRGRARRRCGCQRVEGGSKERGHRLRAKGVACASRHEGSVNGICLTSICGFGFSM